MQSVVRVLGTFTVVLISCMVIAHAGKAKDDINGGYNVRLTESNVSLCEQGRGGEKCKAYSNDELNKFGIFQTREQHPIQAPVVHYGCCQTWGLCVSASGRWMPTVNNQLCYVIQLWNSFQHYTTGTCAAVGVPCSCNGRCQQQYAWITLLAWCPLGPPTKFPFRFEQFKIDSYCACVN